MAIDEHKGGTVIEAPNPYRVTLFDSLSVIASQYLSKDSLVFIDGRIQSRKYSGKDGIERIAYDTMVVK